MPIGVAWAMPPKPEPRPTTRWRHLNANGLATVDRDIAIVIECQINGRTHSSVAREFDISHTRVSQICLRWDYKRGANTTGPYAKYLNLWAFPKEDTKAFYLGYLGLCAESLTK